MKKLSFPIICCILFISSYSQETFYYKDPQSTFLDAKEYYKKGEYSLAYPLFKELRQSIRETDKVNNPVMVQEIDYYTIASGLQQNQIQAENEAVAYIEQTRNNARIGMMSFQLAEYYFRKNQFSNAIQQYEQVNIANLDNR